MSNAQTPEHRPLVTAAEAAEIKGCSVWTIHRRLTPALKGNGRTGDAWYRRADVDALVVRPYRRTDGQAA